ncbi:MAG: hypothetical protein GXP55_08540 [Deltaproteobacteria bacterium]|nr:hypothetical protein [Deltaproteobacteria bacterium]
MRRALSAGLLCVASACAGHAQPTRSAADDAPRRACVLEGSLRLRIPVPRGYALATSPQACVLVNESANDAALLSFASLPADGAEAEAILGTEDGARRWLRASGLVGTDASEIADPVELRLFARTRHAYGLQAQPASLGPSDVFVLHARRAGELLVIMIISPRDDQAHRRELLELLAGVR